MAKKTTGETTPEPKAEKGSVIVTWRGGSRTYTKELHGAEYEALAEEFAGKKGGKIK